MTTVPPDPEVTVAVPLPFVGDEDTVYVAFKATPEFVPLGAEISSLPLIVPVGLAPSAVNSPAKGATPKVRGVIVKPAYIPSTALLVSGPAAWGSPNPYDTEESVLKSMA